MLIWEFACLCIDIKFCHVFPLGVELLKRFKEEFANFEKERQELANAEKLFGLSITLYPELLDMEKELKGLDQIFSIYENQKASNF